MKIWIGHGSEHSYNLVLIGRFIDETRAAAVEEKFERLKEAATTQLPDLGWGSDERFPDELLQVLKELKEWNLSRPEVENFGYDYSLKRRGDRIEITTDEGEIQGFLKVFIEAGARVEIYSAHDWTSDGESRSEDSDDTEVPVAEV